MTFSVITRLILFGAGILTLIFSEIFRVYYIMPFPGSQESETIELAYFLQNAIWYFRVVGFVLILFPLLYFIKSGKPIIKWTLVALIIFWIVVAYAFNFRFLADKMFYQPKDKILVKQELNKVTGNKLVIGVTINNEAKAYPIEIIGYHHQVRDTIGGEPVMITYCTVCRTGRVYSPLVNGQPENFRLVGMDHFNAMFEDATTKSWWRQVNGEAIVGPLTGTTLPEFPSQQMSLSSWLNLYPDSYILQPDNSFKEQYEGLEAYDEGKKQGRLERHDSLSWKDKSWVVGISINKTSKAYDWNELLAERLINDQVDNQFLILAIQNDSVSFHVWNRKVGNDTLTFEWDTQAGKLKDKKYGTLWNWKGQCEDGPLKGEKLVPIQAYQEYWHSWKTFNPETIRYKKK